METPVRTLLVIISESSLEKQLVSDIQELGARGYTISDCRGKGRRGTRDAEWDYDRNIRMEVVCTRETATSIITHLHGKYYENYAMVIFSSEVSVLRPEKF